MSIKSRSMPFISRNFFAKGRVGRLLFKTQSKKRIGKE